MFLEANFLLNNHFNYKYPQIATENNSKYQKYIQDICLMEYLSNSESDDYDYEYDYGSSDNNQD